MNNDYYKVLGLEKDASAEDIKNKYRRLAMQFHPDRNPGDASAESKFKEIGEAYETLNNPEKREQYDSPVSHHTWAHGAGPNNVNINDIFKAFHEAQFTAPPPQPPKQPVNIITITLADAYMGKACKIDNLHALNIPKGVRPGTRFYVDNKIFRVDIYPDSKFKRTDDDLLADVTIDAIEAMIGLDAILTLPNGVKLQFSIPPGIQPGRIVKLSGKGMNNPETDKAGDILVRVTVSIPKLLSDAEKETLRSLTHRSSINI